MRFEHDDFEDPTNQKCTYTIDNSCAFELALNIETYDEFHREYNEMADLGPSLSYNQGISVKALQMLCFISECQHERSFHMEKPNCLTCRLASRRKWN